MRVIEIVKAVGTPGAPVALAEENTDVTYVILQAKRAAADNSGNVFVGRSGVNHSTRQIVEMAPGDAWEPVIPDGRTLDLSDLYVDAAGANDGVTGIAFLK